MQENDADMYDDFGNLKKKFRVKKQQDGELTSSAAREREDVYKVDSQASRESDDRRYPEQRQEHDRGLEKR